MASHSPHVGDDFFIRLRLPRFVGDESLKLKGGRSGMLLRRIARRLAMVGSLGIATSILEQ